MSRYHELLERCNSYRDSENIKASVIENRERAYHESLENTRDEIDMLREARDQKIRNHRKYKALVEKTMLSTALKGIFISSLEECMVPTKQMYNLAESMIDSYVEEKGADAILANMKGKTYLLNTIYEAVEEAEDETMEDTDDSDAETEKVPDEPKDKMMNKLDGEEDVQDAVKVISDRIADAEQEFIQKNAEDKEKIENIVNDINDRIQSVKSDNTTPDKAKEDIADECAKIGKRKISAVYEDRSHSVFETMTHQLMNTIVKDPDLKAQYVDENGQLDTLKVLDVTKCLYGMLEFTNTIQLEKVNEEYIANQLNDLD